MRPSFNEEALGKVTYLVGGSDVISDMLDAPAKEPFSEDILEFLNTVSKLLMKDVKSRQYSDVVTLGFWLRRASTEKLRQAHARSDGNIRLGRGVAFHIAPSNVPVNFAYSLAAGLLTGNKNIVRVPSKEFEQVTIIAEAFNKALEEREDFRPYVVLVRYGREKEINDTFSAITDTRVIWGGDATIAEVRKSPLPPRSSEVTFADRYSLAVVDADAYLANENKAGVAQDFYNDTYFTDQNACTSPRVVVWVGNRKEEAKKAFWEALHGLVEKKYTFQPIQAINKLTSAYLLAAAEQGAQIEEHVDNLLVRVLAPRLTNKLMELKDNCGYFFEYDCDNILDLRPLCDDKRCQTIGLLGDTAILLPLLKSGVRGIDRVVPIGKTMDFELIWDGYDLSSYLTRTIVVK